MPATVSQPVRRPNGMRRVRSSRNTSMSLRPSIAASCRSVMRYIAVSIMPGATLFTVTPNGASASAAVRVTASTPALLAA